ncbi:MAG: hypothetical protein ACLPKT_14055 [Methylocella sp.]
MNRIFTVIAMTSVMLVGARALAVDSVSQSTMSKRQLIAQMVGCMKKRMSANNTISYNEAMKACKDQISKQSDNSASRTLVASDTPTKP